MPVHLTINGEPMCLYRPGCICQYPTRSLAMDALLQGRHLDTRSGIQVGACPECAKKGNYVDQRGSR